MIALKQHTIIAHPYCQPMRKHFMRHTILNVTASAMGQHWLGLSATETAQSATIADACPHLPPPMPALLARRGVPINQIDAFLKPKIRDTLPDPLVLNSMEAAAVRLLHAVRKQESIAIFADYDVDGAVSATLLADWLQHMHITPTLYIPDRLREGYGPNPQSIQALAAKHRLIVCVDCGSGAQAQNAFAHCQNSDVVVLDHHASAQTSGHPNPVCAMVNPQQANDNSGLGYLCAAGIVFLLLVDVNRRCRAQNLDTPDLMSMLDILALATIADVVPLIGVNRAFVMRGLRGLRTAPRLGLSALMQAMNIVPETLTARDLGFALAPVLNAGGRMGNAEITVRLLRTTSSIEAKTLAGELIALNQLRRETETQVYNHAYAHIARTFAVDAPLLWAADAHYHPGVAGIVAARITQAFGKPTVIIGWQGNQGKGSGRSIAGVDLARAITAAQQNGAAITGGGHTMAIGVSLARQDCDAAMQTLSNHVAVLHQQAPITANECIIDAILTQAQVDTGLVRAIEQLGPYGLDAPMPRIVLPNQIITYHKRIGAQSNHMQFVCVDAGCGQSGARLRGIYFRAFHTSDDGNAGAGGDNTPIHQRAALAHMLESSNGRPLHLAGHLVLDTWGGNERVQFHLCDAAYADI